jgi:hypothetical protein
MRLFEVLRQEPEWEHIGKLDLSRQNPKLTALPRCPESVSGYFSCHDNALTSLRGCPRRVGGSFLCSDNRIETLEWMPEEVGGSFWCYGNPTLGSLRGIGGMRRMSGTLGFDGCPIESGVLEVFRVEGATAILMNKAPLVRDILNRHLVGERDALDCLEELTANGLKGYARR